MKRRKMKLWHLPLRLSTGAFILNSGVGKLHASPETALRLRDTAGGAFPGLAEVSPASFAQGLALSEVALGVALVNPMVSSGLAGLCLGAFSGGLCYLYAKTDALHEPGSLRPTQAGTAIAKDVWMLGIALALVIGAVTER